MKLPDHVSIRRTSDGRLVAEVDIKKLVQSDAYKRVAESANRIKELQNV